MAVLTCGSEMGACMTLAWIWTIRTAIVKFKRACGAGTDSEADCCEPCGHGRHMVSFMIAPRSKGA